MSIHLDFVCADQPIDAPQRYENPVRAIGEILPLVLAKYGIDRAVIAEVPTSRDRACDYSI